MAIATRLLDRGFFRTTGNMFVFTPHSTAIYLPSRSAVLKFNESHPDVDFPYPDRLVV
ncbi:MAG: hypothetical protein ACSNEK_09840 [Parachlamydiaceae bacterium]